MRETNQVIYIWHQHVTFIGLKVSLPDPKMMSTNLLFQFSYLHTSHMLYLWHTSGKHTLLGPTNVDSSNKKRANDSYVNSSI